MLALAPQQNQLRPAVPEGDREFLGIFARRDAGAIPPGFLADGRNLRCRRGVAATRPGTARPAWANRTQSATDNLIRPYGTIYGVGSFKDPQSLDWTLIVADGQVYRTREGNPSQTIPLPAGVSIRSPSVPVQAFNQVYLFRGRYLQPLVLSSFDTGFTDLVARWSSATVYTAPSVGVAASEMAYGPYQAVTSITSAGTVATVTTTLAHGYVTGADVLLIGANQSEYNVRATITVLDDVTFTYDFAGSATTPATGTIKVTNNAYYWKAVGSQLLTGVTAAAVTTTVTVTKTSHGFTTGQKVTVSGATGADAGLYNGSYTITGTTANTFTYTTTGSPAGAATGTLTVRNNSVVLAGQSPDSNPEAWQRLYTILPNADNAIYTQDRLLVPTAFNPDSGEYDGKVDYVVATDYLDNIHFDFPADFRINQGGDDEIVDLCKFNDSGTVLVFKQKSVYVLSGIGVDLSQVSLDSVIEDYGLAAPRAWCVVGNNVYFLATSRGIAGVQQTVQNKLQGVDIPLSDPIADIVQRILWRLARGARLAWWDSKLYCAVPLDDGGLTYPGLVPAGATYRRIAPGQGYYAFDCLKPGTTYTYTPDTAGGSISVDGQSYTTTTTFVVHGTQAILLGPPNSAVGAQLTPAPLAGVNNTILVFDFLAVALQGRDLQNPGSGYDATSSRGAWQSRDDGPAICPQEFFLAYSHGRQRLFFASADGWINLLEETSGGDFIAGVESVSGLSRVDISTYILTRGHAWQSVRGKRARKMQLVLATWNPTYSLAAVNAGVGTRKALVTARTKDATRYYKPWNATPWVTSNVNLDQQKPHREDYSVSLLTTGVYFDNGLLLDALQEITETLKLSGVAGRLVQVEITNTTGRLELRGTRITAQETDRRRGPTQ